MFNGLTYPGLRCILEYLDVNKRIHIAARSHVLQKFEKKIPLHIDHLTLNNNFISANNVTHEITSRGQYICSNPMGKQSNFHRTGLNMMNNIKKMMFYLLDGRDEIYVNQLELLMWKDWRVRVLPVNLQLKIRKLNICDCFSLHLLCMSVIHPSSFPLMELTTEIRNTDDLDHYGPQTAKMLRISLRHPEDEDWVIPSVADLNNTNIVIEGMTRDSDEVGYRGLIWSWLQAPRSIGASLMIRGITNWKASTLLDALKDQHDWTEVYIKRVVERLSCHVPCSNPINPTTAVLVYGIYQPFPGTLFDVKVEIVSTDLISPAVVRF